MGRKPNFKPKDPNAPLTPLEQLRADKRGGKRDIKVGILGKEEEKIIEKMAQLGHTDADIAEKLGRSPKQIYKYRTKAYVGDDVDLSNFHNTIKDLRERFEYKRMKEEFTHKEMQFLEHEYVKMLGVIGEDMTLIDENAIFDAIRWKIFEHRTSTDRLENREQIEELIELSREIVKHIDEETKVGKNTGILKDLMVQLNNIEQQIQALKVINKESTNELKTFAEKHSDIMKSLKTTRDQRIQKIQDNRRDSFIPLLQQIAKEKPNRQIGLEVELAKKARDKEKKRLGKPHKFVDGEWRRPILTSETIDFEGDEDATPEETGNVEATQSQIQTEGSRSRSLLDMEERNN